MNIVSDYRAILRFNGHGAHVDIDHLHERLTFLLDTGYNHLKTRKFVDNFLKRKREWLFRFVIDSVVEKTNNKSECSLRPSVIYRKVSGGTRSSHRFEAYDTFFFILRTQKLMKKYFIWEVPPRIAGKGRHPGLCLHTTDLLLSSKSTKYTNSLIF